MGGAVSGKQANAFRGAQRELGEMRRCTCSGAEKMGAGPEAWARDRS